MRLPRFFVPIVSVIMLVALAGCVTPKADPAAARSNPFGNNDTGRANPGYIQWLKKQAMLEVSSKMSSVVSGTNLFWLAPYEQPRPEEMLKLAPTWLTVDSARVLLPANTKMLRVLNKSRFLDTVGRMGFQGVHFASLRESGKIWGTPSERHQLGEDTVTYEFAGYVGDSRDFDAFLRKANSKRIIAGDQTVPLATGRGADYFLNVRGAPEYKGLYCVVEVPRNLWDKLPEITTRTRSVEIPEENLRQLRRARLLPPPFEREQLKLSLTPLIWFATDEVKGMDGNSRRYAYLGYGSDARPLLNWNDPSSAAKRVISGSLIQQIGMLHSALTSVRVEPLYGTEPAYPTADRTESGVRNTAIRAAVDIGQEARRYGGWTFLQDNLPLQDLKASMEHGVDFVTNHAVATSAQLAFASGDTTLLRQSIIALQQMGIDQKHLVNRIQPELYIDFSFPFMYQAGNSKADAFKQAQLDSVRRKLFGTGGDVFFDGKKLYLTPAAYVAYVEGIRDCWNMTTEQKQTVADGLTLLGQFQALQPGLFMMSPDELMGVLPLKSGLLEYTTAEEALRQNLAGAYDLTDRSLGNIITDVGLPKAQTAFGDIAASARYVDSFTARMKGLIALRRDLGMAQATLIQMPEVKEKGVIIQVYKLPARNRFNAKYVVTAVNFGREAALEEVALTKGVMSSSGVLEEVLTGEKYSSVSNKFSLPVPARTAQVYVLKDSI